MNNKLNLKSPWNEVKEKIKEHNIEITDEDLIYNPGQEEQLLERLSRKLHKNKEETKAYVESISANKTQAG